MKFDINAYNDRTVMHCGTIEQAIIFTKHLNSLGLKWCTERSYEEKNCWNTYGAMTCYRFKEGTFGDLDLYRGLDEYQILEFEDFEWDGFVNSEAVIVSSEDSEKIDNFLSDFSKN